MNQYIFALCEHALNNGMICPEDKTWAVNNLLQVLQLDEEPERPDALRREAARIEAAIPAGAYVIAMCIEGKELSSTQLAEKLRAVQNGGSSKICLIIGSSNGMDDSIKQRADFRLSMSPMTFPHHLARVMVLEQVYRGLSILAGSKYHK